MQDAWRREGSFNVKAALGGVFLFRIFCWLSMLLLKDCTGIVEERGGMACSKGPQGGTKLVVAAVRTQPLFMGRPLYHLSYQGAPTLEVL